MIDVLPDQLSIIESILKTHVPNHNVWAFGSRVRTCAKEHSDLDLVIIGNVKLPLATLASLKETFEESVLPYRVDIVDWHRISEKFRSVIKQNYVALQTSGGIEQNE